MSETAELTLAGDRVELPVVVGTENERGVDITQLRARTGHITLDSGYANTGSCQSAITYIDGERGVLRYRGYPIEELAEQSTFTETAWLLIFGELPTAEQIAKLRDMLTQNELIHEGLRHHFEGFPPDAHPMAMLSTMINAMSCYHPELLGMYDEEQFLEAAVKLLSKVRTISAFAYKKAIGQPIVYPHPERSYCDNFLHMMFSIPNVEYEASPEALRALSQFLILHADHEQNCSTSTVRMVGSSKANLFASVAAGVSALWGPLHGGANLAVIEMLEGIRQMGRGAKELVERVKTDRSTRLMGFGHRVYKNFDPRAQILKNAADGLLATLGIEDPLLEIILELEDIATHDDYFLERKLYPNVDFYSGIILRAIGIPMNMFTVMFAIGRMPGWIAHWYEAFQDPKGRINRPRQIYTGPTHRNYVPTEER